MPRVTLWNIEGVMLILLRDSGVIYTNQTGGHACAQPEAEGILAPFNNSPPLDQPDLSTESQLKRVLTGAQRLTPAQADEVDEILAHWQDTKCAKVDRTRLTDSMEAWVYVDVNECGDDLISGFGPCKGIITWSNSD